MARPVARFKSFQVLSSRRAFQVFSSFVKSQFYTARRHPFRTRAVSPSVSAARVARRKSTSPKNTDLFRVARDRSPPRGRAASSRRSRARTIARARIERDRAATRRRIERARARTPARLIDRLIEPIKLDLDSTGWAADHDLIHAKGLRHLGLRLGHHSGEVLITLISSHDRYPGLLELAEDWMDRWEMVKGVCLNLQPKANNLVLGPETLLVAGSATIAEEFCGIDLQLNSNTFFQINTPQAERIVNLLCDWLKTEIGEGTVVDAYCGIGTISLPLAAQGFDVIGLELHQGSVDQALLNAMRNNLSDQCRFRAGDVVDLLEAALVGADTLVLDPPRRGLDARVVQTILDTPPQRLAYLSCDPATQARDLKMLTEPDGPYRLKKHQPVDFFPQTTHLESLALLERVSSAAQL